MKVVHIASGDGWGGAEHVVALLAESVSRLPGVTVDALLFNEGRLADVLRASSIRVHVVAESNRSFGKLVRDARRWIQERGADVVHAHRYKDIVVGAVAVLGSKRRLVVTIHGLEPREELPVSRIVILWSSLILARCVGARFVAVSNELAVRLTRVLGQRAVCQIPNPMPERKTGEGFPDLRRQFGWPSGQPVVGFIGRLEPVKGPDILLQVAESTESGASFVFIGAGSMEQQLSQRADASGLARRVVFLGEKPNAAGYLAQFDVLALPSRHEGLPLVLLEAAACEVPVVAFDVGGVRQVLDGGGAAVSLAPPRDADAFRVALDEMLRNRVAAERDAHTWAASVRSRFSMETIAERYAAVYRAAGPGTQRLSGAETRPTA